MTKPSPVRLERRGEIALLLIAHPPVNALGLEVVAGLAQALDAFAADTTARALVVACEGRTFVAGGDIAGFDDPAFSAAPANRVLARMEQMDRPVVAAMHGFALGGGLELALACHWRVAVRGTQLGLPEVKLGLVPGSLGTQRLPRLVGLPLAFELIWTGRSIDAELALQCGLVDAVGEDNPVDLGIAFAQDLVARAVPPRRTSALSVDRTGLDPAFFAKARKRARSERGAYPAALAIVDTLEASALAFEQGERVEALTFEALRASPESKALRYLFFAQRKAAKVPGATEAGAPRALQAVGVLGTGPAARRLVADLLHAQLRVAQFDDADAALQEPGLADCDLVIDALAQEPASRRLVFQRLGATCKPGAILSTVDPAVELEALAESSARGGDVLRMQFVGPATMEVVEIAGTAATAPAALLAAVKLAQRMDKVPVVAGTGRGSISGRLQDASRRAQAGTGERALSALVEEGTRLLEEGVARNASDIDLVWTRGFGFPDYLGGPMYLRGN